MKEFYLWLAYGSLHIRCKNLLMVWRLLRKIDYLTQIRQYHTMLIVLLSRFSPITGTIAQVRRGEYGNGWVTVQGSVCLTLRAWRRTHKKKKLVACFGCHECSNDVCDTSWLVVVGHVKLSSRRRLMCANKVPYW